MPGKQMAIDADLNAGFISAEQARERREEVTREADFYGSMDGASKFVKGDAIAGIVILVINIVGGLFVGMIQHDLSFSRAMEVYTLLTIGDGLVAQLPLALTNRGTRLIATQHGANVRVLLAVRMRCAKRIQWTHSLTVHGISHALLPHVQTHQQMLMTSPIG